jgi:N-acetylglutamate synthase-like GNAT family acetyltransferase
MIRKYKPDDLGIIMDMGNRAWSNIYKMFREAYGDELFQIIVPNEKTRKGDQIKSHCENHPEWVFICEEGGQIVGFITFTLDFEKKIGEIGSNAKEPNCNLKGIGQQMYKAVLDYFQKQGMRYAKVHTGLDYAHAPAKKAYEMAGFNIYHEDIDYYMKL